MISKLLQKMTLQISRQVMVLQLFLSDSIVNKDEHSDKKS